MPDAPAAPAATAATEPAAPQATEAAPAPGNQEAAPTTTTTTTTPDAPLGEAGEKALEAWKERAKTAEADAKEARAKAQEYEDKDKSELEKVTGKLTKAEERAAAAETELLRFKVGTEKGLDPDLMPFLTGTSREELEAKADVLMSKVGKQTPAPSFDGGARETAPESKTPEQAHSDFLLGVLGVPQQT